MTAGCSPTKVEVCWPTKQQEDVMHKQKNEVSAPPPLVTQPILNVEEAARIARLHPNTIRKLVNTKQLPAKRAGRRILIRHVDLEAYLKPN
jgi:excisionase family DNA binding protein